MSKNVPIPYTISKRFLFFFAKLNKFSWFAGEILSAGNVFHSIFTGLPSFFGKMCASTDILSKVPSA